MSWTLTQNGDNADAALFNKVENALGLGNPAQPAKYIVYFNSDTSEYEVRNGLDGTIDFSGSNAATILQAVLDTIDIGGSLFLKRDTYTLGATQLTLSGTDQALPQEMPILIFSDGAVITYEGAGAAIKLTNDVEHVHIQGPLVIKTVAAAAGIDGIELNTAQRCKISGVTVYGYGVTDSKSAFIIRNESHWNNFLHCDPRNIQTGFWADAVGANYPHAGNIIACNGHMISSFATIEAEAWSVLGGLVDTDTAAPTMLNVTATGHFANIIGGRYENAVGGGGGTLITVAAGAQNCKFTDIANTGFTTVVSDAGTNTSLDNIGNYVIKNSGSDTIANGTTSKVVAHGLSVTPSAEHFTIIGKENPTADVGTIWVDTIGAANFTVNVENDPGASDWDFGWKVDTR